MTGFDWDVLAAGLGVGVIAMTALRLRRTRRRAQFAQADPEKQAKEDRCGGD